MFNGFPGDKPRVGGGGSSSGGVKPATSIQIPATAIISASSPTVMRNYIGGAITASITSATLTEVINISGSGYFTFLAMGNTTGSTITTPKIKITIDGVIAADGTTANIPAGDNVSLIGAFNDTQDLYSEGLVLFNSSIIIEISGDGTNGSQIVYKRYLT